MNKLLTALLAGVLIMGVGCGGSRGANTTSSTTTTAVTMTVCPTYVTWNKAVAEWNALTDERDATYGKGVFIDGIIVNGTHYPTYEDWARATNHMVYMQADPC